MAGFGLKLIRTTGLDGLTGNQNEYPIDPTNTDPIFTGDLVRLTSGFVVEASGGANNNDFSVLGVFQGCRYVDTDGSFVFKNHWDGGAGRSNVIANVGLPDGATFLIKGAAAGTYTQANIGSRFGVVYAAGSTVYGDSRVSMGATAAGTGPLLLHRLVEYPRNSFSAAEPLFEVVVARKQGFPALA